MRVIEALQDLVAAEGLIGAVSSGQGSITNNETGMREVYRGSKASGTERLAGWLRQSAGGVNLSGYD